MTVNGTVTAITTPTDTFQLGAAQLEDVTSLSVFGTDEEAALVKGIAAAFPSGHRLTCLLHLKENVK